MDLINQLIKKLRKKQISLSINFLFNPWTLITEKLTQNKINRPRVKFTKQYFRQNKFP